MASQSRRPFLKRHVKLTKASSAVLRTHFMFCWHWRFTYVRSFVLDEYPRLPSFSDKTQQRRRPVGEHSGTRESMRVPAHPCCELRQVLRSLVIPQRGFPAPWVPSSTPPQLRGPTQHDSKTYPDQHLLRPRGLPGRRGTSC